jgi:hypothetical protein
VPDKATFFTEGESLLISIKRFRSVNLTDRAPEGIICGN